MRELVIRKEMLFPEDLEEVPDRGTDYTVVIDYTDLVFIEVYLCLSVVDVIDK